MNTLATPSIIVKSTPSEYFPRVGVGIYVFNHGRLLVGKRLGSLGFGTWAVPGGHLEFEESVEDCVRRELFEETGLVALSIKKGGWVNSQFKKERKHYVTVFMIVDKFSGELTAKEPDKCEEWKWFFLDDLPTPLFEPLVSVFNDINQSHLDLKAYFGEQL